MSDELEQAGPLSHLDESGRAKMVDVGDKAVTAREARAEATVNMTRETLDLITSGSMPKGDVFSTARIAGVMAAKKTHDVIPLCHPLKIDSISVDFDIDRVSSAVKVTTLVRATDRTGVEMEALHAAAVAALTIYDMCKAVERSIEIAGLRLVHKSGGKSGTWEREGR
ncbi:MAG: cyclic pyranopterin monophosphate synthase MoaC [Actinobacteria bacterium]|nr:cyclic pyranopterin monophosphate synthase MoaC [Actinomycetota bacterium]